MSLFDDASTLMMRRVMKRHTHTHSHTKSMMMMMRVKESAGGFNEELASAVMVIITQKHKQIHASRNEEFGLQFGFGFGF